MPVQRQQRKRSRHRQTLTRPEITPKDLTPLDRAPLDRAPLDRTRPMRAENLRTIVARSDIVLSDLADYRDRSDPRERDDMAEAGPRQSSRQAGSPLLNRALSGALRRSFLRHEVIETAGTMAGGLLALLRRTGGIPHDLWREPYALGFMYCVIGGLSLHAGIDEDDLPEVMSAAFGAVLDQTRSRTTDPDDVSAIDTADFDAAARQTTAYGSAASRHPARKIGEKRRIACRAKSDDAPDEMGLRDKNALPDENGLRDERELRDEGGLRHDGLNRLAAAIALMTEENSDFIAGLDAGDKVIAVTLGYSDYDDDATVIDARRDADALSAPGCDAPSWSDTLMSDDLTAEDLESYVAAQLSRDEATILCLQQRLFCHELRRRLTPVTWLN